LIIQFKSVERRLETAPPSDFQILLFPNGTIVYQYLAMNMVTKNSATIGMQNATKNDGLQVVFNANYVKNNLAIRFRPPAKFLTVTPNSGTVPAGQFLDLTVGFNAAGLFGGVYNGQVHIVGNDPIQPVKDVPCQLTVTGVPDIAVTPANVDFGTVFIGFPQLRQLTINNTGTDALVVSNITSSDPVYGVDQTSFSVPPLGSAALFAAFNPGSVASYPATFTIASNDPDTPNKVVPLSGSAIVPPDVSTTPTSIAATLNIPNGTTRTLTVHNTGGSDLTFTAGAVLTTGVTVTQHVEMELEKEEVDPRPGILGAGGPDLFGYTWRDSDEPGGPAFDWVDITGVGTAIPFTGDDQNQGPFPLPFAFPFYGQTFNSFRACTNGWISFTSTSTDFTNDPLPNGSAPENLVAAFWDDLTFSSAGDAYYHYDGEKFIVSWVAVPRLTSGGPYTFQMLLFPSGTIRFQYLDMQGTRLNEATVGIQNAARNDGLMAVHNASYVHNNLAVEFRTLPEYMSVSPNSGTIPVGGSTDLTVTFDTEGMFGGLYQGAIRIGSNDPDEGVLMVPTSLTAVGVPNIAATPATLDFGSPYVGQTVDRVVQLRNVGSDVLSISGVSFTDPSYTLVAGTLPANVGFNGTATLTVRFTPTTSWTPGAPCPGPTPVPANMVVASNDPDGPFAVPLNGTAVVPPEVDPVPASVVAALAPALGPSATTKTKTVMLRNLGCSDLNFTTEALSALPQVISGADAEGPKDDPGVAGEPTILAHGGPDAAGYRWADSDDPFGPAFDWVDITGVGTPIPFSGDDQNQGPFALPFPFTFYGQTFNSFRACTNGWISFTSTLTTFTNTVLPSGGATAPENAIAAFWDDLTFSSAGDVYRHYDGEKYIISYVNVPRLGSGGPYSFQILLYPSGTIDFQYLSMQGTRLNEATIGIQNATKDVGLQVVFNAPYVKNNHRIRFTRQSGWLTVSPAAGVVPAGGELALSVAMDASSLADGDYDGVVRIQSNDLDEGTKDVPVDLHVGYVSAALQMDPNSLNRNSHGKWVNTLVTPPSPHTPEQILTPSLLLQRTLPVAEGSPVAYEDTYAQYKFDRAALLDMLPSGEEVPVEIIGEIEDVTWFSATDAVRVLPPQASLNQGQNHYVADTDVDLVWADPPGRPADSFDLWYSANDGESWTQMASGLTVRSYRWRVPSQGTQTGRIEIVAVDEQGPMGSYISDAFTIMTGVTGVEEDLPIAFGLEMAGSNPTRGTARLEMALPRASDVEVRVYDVRGRQVRDLASGGFNAGRHFLRWDGQDQAGSPVGAGIYFVRMLVNGEAYKVRVAYMR
ncbi:MAG TPA: choice-of-anchor D domain-containing protein, partial [Nocardioides sp.]|nr:choice-of-anchor D domain-containing protein [Nocardioides sp.]